MADDKNMEIPAFRDAGHQDQVLAAQVVTDLINLLTRAIPPEKAHLVGPALGMAASTADKAFEENGADPCCVLKGLIQGYNFGSRAIDFSKNPITQTPPTATKH